MPQLREHQLRVAAVSEVILNHSSLILNHSDIVAACLLHDMGNIIKFDLRETASVLNQNIDFGYWQQVKDNFKKKYGPNEHFAHMAIAKEAGANERVIELINSIGFTTAVKNAASGDFGKKICGYADSRVSPRGVASLEERLSDLRKRYARHHQDSPERNAYESAVRQIEFQIFEHCNIKPEDINEETITETKERLKTFEI
jgi:hypothetical protein